MPTDLSRLRKIDSRQNSLVKEFRKAFHGGELTGDGYCAIESIKTIEEAIRSGLRLRGVMFSESARNRADRLLPQLAAHVETIIVSDDVFASAVATDTPQGVAAFARIPQHELSKVLEAEEPLLVVAAGLQDPGNLGTLIRSAEAFGSAAVLTTEGSVSHFNPKAVRASAGSIFRLPVIKVASRELVEALKAKGLRLLATSSHKGTAINQADLRGAVALFIGSEGAGLAKALLQQIDETVVIPHFAAVESLNAGVAASIVLYEAARQRSSERS